MFLTMLIVNSCELVQCKACQEFLCLLFTHNLMNNENLSVKICIMLIKDMPEVNSIIFFSNRAIKIFQQVLYIDPSFNCSNEVHLRLGIIFKAQGSCEASIKVSEVLDSLKPRQQCY